MKQQIPTHLRNVLANVSEIFYLLNHLHRNLLLLGTTVKIDFVPCFYCHSHSDLGNAYLL